MWKWARDWMSRLKNKEEEKWFEVKIPWSEMDCQIPAAFSFPVRNYKTILRKGNENLTHSCDCGSELSIKLVEFQIWAKEIRGGFGQVEMRPVLWCPRCDSEPLNEGIIRLPTGLALALSQCKSVKK